MNNNWHVWTINQQRYKRVIEFLSSLDFVEDFLYPTAVKEYETKSGKKEKNVPLYNNYIFVKYIYNSKIEQIISECEWVLGYIGVCSQQEINEVIKLTNKNYDDLIEKDGLREGDVYKLIGTPFKGMDCTVVSVDGDSVVVAVKLFGSDRMVKCAVDDIQVEG